MMNIYQVFTDSWEQCQNFTYTWLNVKDKILHNKMMIICFPSLIAFQPEIYHSKFRELKWLYLLEKISLMTKQ